MVEVFKTNVADPLEAELLVELIHKTFSNYAVNFDLEDCDRILRVASAEKNIDPASLIAFMAKRGYSIEALPDGPETGMTSATDEARLNGSAY